MQKMKWIAILFMASLLCAGPVLAAAPAAPVGENASKEEQTGHARHGMKNCMEMGGKKCMEMDGKGCDCCKDCMQENGKQCDHNKGKKPPHKSHDASNTMKGAAKPDKKKPDGKDETTKPASKAAESAISEAEGRALAEKSNCFSCHSIDKKVIGPAWKDVAAKYRGDTDAESKLIAKVSRGGLGTWGSVPMPANSPSVKDADIKALVKFILSLK